MACLVTGWTPSPPSPPTPSPLRWPTRGPSSSLRASLTLHQTPPPRCPPLTFSPQTHQRATLTTTPSQSGYPIYSKLQWWCTLWVTMSDEWSFLWSSRFSFEREGSPQGFFNPNEDEEPGMCTQHKLPTEHDEHFMYREGNLLSAVHMLLLYKETNTVHSNVRK